MYGRGARVLTQPALSTAPGVGPGTYRVENLASYSRIAT